MFYIISLCLIMAIIVDHVQQLCGIPTVLWRTFVSENLFILNKKIQSALYFLKCHRNIQRK